MYNGTIERSSYSGMVAGDQWVGGLVGSHYGRIIESFVNGLVLGRSRVGGLAADVSGEITNSYTTSSVYSEEENSGALASELTNTDKIEGVYSTVYTENPETINGQEVAGLPQENLTRVDRGWDEYIQTRAEEFDPIKLFVLTVLSDLNNEPDWLVEITIEQARQQASYPGLDFENVWNIVEGLSFPFLRNNVEEPLPGTIVSLERGSELPVKTELHQNYPNPFNPVSLIRYDLSRDARITLEVFDLLGRRVALLVDGIKPIGYHSVPFRAEGLASGIYIYRLIVDNEVYTRKLTVLK